MRIECVVVLLCLVVLTTNATAGPCSSSIPQGSSEHCDSITQYGITWTLSANSTVGQFVTGDYWVLDGGIGVTITGISPGQTGSDPMINGSMKNPTVDGYQCLDSRANSYSAGVCLQAPFTLVGGDALISSISVDSFSADWSGDGIDSHTFVGAASVLTVVSSQPASGSFRPAYTDRSQTMYNISAIDTSKLPNLHSPTVISPETLQRYERGSQRPWLLWVTNWGGRSIHAVQNMYEYHREISNFLSTLALILLTDTQNKDTLIRNMCQLGVEYYYIGSQGEGDSAFYMYPILFAGILMDIPEFKNISIDGNLLGVPRDYPDFYYYEDKSSTLESQIVTSGQTWTGHTVFYRNQVGVGEHEHLHPSEWDVPVALDHWKNESYRDIDSPTQVGMVLSARLLGNNAMAMWNHPATFDYIDRWMSEDRLAQCQIKAIYSPRTCTAETTIMDLRSRSAFVDSMWNEYRHQYNRRLFRNVRLHSEE